MSVATEPAPTTTTHPISDAVQGLADLLGDRIVLDLDERKKFETDFGMVVFNVPGAVAKCRNSQEVAEVVRYCREHGVPIVGRGQGHTQTGQSTTQGGVVVDTEAMQVIHEINTEELWADCDAGVVWRDLVMKSVPLGYVPPVLTNNLGVSIAGTTSVAGLGVASYRYGTQADNAIEFEIVTGTGEILRCSSDENRELYDAARCGLSQFGIITRVKTRLRPCKQKIRMYHLLYDDLGDFMKDAEAIMKPDPRFSSLESRCAPCPIFMKRIGDGLKLREGAQLYAYWTYPMFLTVEYSEGEEPNDEELLEGLCFHRHLRTDEYTMLEFCRRLEPVFEIWDNSGNWEMAHPWVESVLPWDKAQEFIEFALDNLPPQSLGPAGHILLWPSRADTSKVPFFKHPGGEFVMGWGVLPAVPPKFLDMALEQLDMVSELSIGYGGKRYLSGYITFDKVEDWKNHFGEETWAQFCAAKKKYDPDGIMAPGFITYE
ncbi:MAG: FAD-binding protein [Acidobacteriota bacterium]